MLHWFRRRSAALGLCLATVLTAPAATRAAEATIRIIVDGPWDRNEPILDLYRQEMTTLLGDEFGVRFPAGSVTVADWTAEGVRLAITAALNDPEVDLVVGLGVLASHELCLRGDLPKPAIAPFVIDPGLQGVPFRDGTSGVRNLCYITSMGRLSRDFRTFGDIVPFDRMAFLTTATLVEAIPELGERAREAGEAQGLSVSIHAIAGSATEALASIPASAEAVYVAPLLQLSDAEFDTLVSGLIERRLPSFSLFGRTEVDRGILAGSVGANDMARRARRAALNVQRMLLGEDGGTLPVQFSEAERLSLNLATARAIGVRPTWAVLTEAELVDRDRVPVDRRITLVGAVRDAIAVNRDLQAADRAVVAGTHEVGVARATLLPSAEVSATGAWLDRDLVQSSFGQAERQITGAVSVSQLLLSDGAWAGLDIERRTQLIRELTRDGLRLDVTRDAWRAYLNVLRALTRERIQRENLERTRAHLEVARVREAVGYSGPGEVYRWEGEIATQRKELIRANADRNVAEIELNRLLHRPLEEPFVVANADLLTPGVGVSQPRLRVFLEDPWSFRVLREFLEEEATRESPKISALDEAIAAQQRALASATRAFWVPTVGIEGELSHVIGQYGEGSDPGASLGPIAGPPDTQWKVGLRASLPLFEGGARVARRRESQESLGELEYERQAVTERVRQAVRSSMHQAGASYAGIELSGQAALAAHRSLELVADAYTQGVVPVLDLLDAQNAALVAEEGSANAEFDFLLDLADVQRAVGSFFCLDPPERNEDFIGRLEQFRREREDR